MSNDLCSKKIIMLTRPYGQAYGMIELVRKLGWPAYNEPIVEIEPISGPVGWSSNLAAIAVTSPNGARCLESVAGLARTIPVFAVGSATADELRLRGFSNIDVSDGTAQTLIHRLTKRMPRDTGVIAHVNGEHIACDIAAELSARG
jgi:uroporphyrinogen-III synthase